jgi:hypothetical protein
MPCLYGPKNGTKGSLQELELSVHLRTDTVGKSGKLNTPRPPSNLPTNKLVAKRVYEGILTQKRICLNAGNRLNHQQYLP